MTNILTKTWQFNFEGIGNIKEIVENIRQFHHAKNYPYPLPNDAAFIAYCENFEIVGGTWVFTYTQFKILGLKLLE